MNGSDQKFWIGIASAFILPTLAYVYAQGMTAQSIEQLAKSVEKFQSNVDAANGRINNAERLTESNTAAIASINSDLFMVSPVGDC